MKNRRGWKMRKSKMLETDVFAQHYALVVLCMLLLDWIE